MRYLLLLLCLCSIGAQQLAEPFFIRHGYFKDRIKHLERAYYEKNQQHLSLLLSCLTDADDSIRYHAIKAIQQLSIGEKHIPLLVRSVYDTSRSVAEIACETLEKFAEYSPSHIADVWKLVHTNDRYYALRGFLAHKQNIVFLQEILEDTQRSVEEKNCALSILGRLGKEALTIILPYLEDDRYYRTVFLALKSSKLGVEPLLELLMLNNKDFGDLRTLCRAVGPQSLDILVAKSTFYSVEQYVQVLRIISRISPTTQMDFLLESLQHPHVKICREALYILRQLKDKRIVPQIMKVMKTRTDVTENAVVALTALRGKEAIPVVVKLLGDSDQQICRQVIVFIASLHQKQYCAEIEKFIEEPSLKSQAILALYHMKPEKYQKMCDDLFVGKKSWEIFDIADSCEFMVYKPLVSLLGDSSIHVRRNAASYIYGKNSHKALLEGMYSKNDVQANNCIAVLQREAVFPGESLAILLRIVKKHPSAVSLLLNGIQNNVSAAVDLLEKHPHIWRDFLLVDKEKVAVHLDKIIPYCIQGLQNNERGPNSFTITGALARWEAVAAIDDLVAILPKVKGYVAENIIELLDALSAKQTLDEIVKLTKHKEQSVRKAAIALVSKWSPQHPQIALVALNDEHDEARTKAIECLHGYEEDKAIAILGKCLQQKNGRVKVAAVKALGKYSAEKTVDLLRGALVDYQTISGFFRSDRYSVSSFASSVLAEKGNAAKKAIPELLQVVSSARLPYTRRVAAIALGKIVVESESSVKVLIEALDDGTSEHNAAVFALARAGKIAVAQLTEALENENDLIARGACIALGEMKTRSNVIINALLKCAQKEECRWSALWALCELGITEELAPKIIRFRDDKNWHTRYLVLQIVEPFATSDTLKQFVADENWCVSETAKMLQRKRESDK
ncbi:HEAT repeat domain-containing protein [Candidatus Uabimicrobium amorphum]|uniref:Clathrin/coatomer adaptor adaptin-like N-terminal domain-containing protein n=1 Tax=Uabimicrobium amorphum TaxID=2596890 RepID=A0A5S9IUB0_UABAM|nr:HEAT repeat domain-containing protein [Candidatus Uabimicrobium amorphum]BBM87766.1 hypothetical protein UABAM_06181 [Candidatus Uabimicrobium amorphum]